MEFKGIIFDLDGVLCFTDKYHYTAWKQLADGIGVYFDEKINERLRGVSRMASLEIILENSARKYSEQEKEEFAERKNGLYRKLLENMKPEDISGDVRKTLEKLREKGIALAIGSSSKNTPMILKKTDMQKYFDAISDGNNITHSKPDPEVFLKAAEFLGLKPSECLVVEDAEAGIDAACAGGFKSAGIGSASHYSRTTYPIKALSDLLNL